MRLHDLYNGHEQPYCSVSLENDNQWLRAVWRGDVPLQDAERGAQTYLEALRQVRAPFLLNDNSLIAGPWFDSTEWLVSVWAPQAAALGLRYIAHVTPPGVFSITAEALTYRPFGKQFELQVFDNVEEAEIWLRSCQEEELATKQQ
jgi:hypothetical protein